MTKNEKELFRFVHAGHPGLPVRSVIRLVKRKLPPPTKIVPSGKQRLINRFYEAKGEEQ